MKRMLGSVGSLRLASALGIMAAASVLIAPPASVAFAGVGVLASFSDNSAATEQAAAVQSGIFGDSYLMPIALPFPCNYDPLNPDGCSLQYQNGVAYTLTDDPQLPGGFKWVDYGGGASATHIVNYLTLTEIGAIMVDSADTFYNPALPTQYNTPPPSPNPWISSGLAVQANNNIQTALDGWLDLSKWGTLSGGSVNWGPKPLTNNWFVPIYDHDNGLKGSNIKYHVASFSEFQLIGYWFGSNQCNYVGAPPNPNCKYLPDNPNPGWQLQSCKDANKICLLVTFLR